MKVFEVLLLLFKQTGTLTESWPLSDISSYLTESCYLTVPAISRYTWSSSYLCSCRHAFQFFLEMFAQLLIARYPALSKNNVALAVARLLRNSWNHFAYSVFQLPFCFIAQFLLCKRVSAFVHST